MMTENKVTEIFCIADDFCKFFDAMTAKYTLKPNGKRKYHRDSTMSKAEVMLIMILFHDSGCCCFIEKVNDELKNIAQVGCSRHRCFGNFIVKSLGAIAAYCLSP
ncbi:MAG: transposase [Prevotella histicola]|nr:transposase [Prevotella histicola]